MLHGNLGRAVIKTSAVKPEHRQVKAPARVFDDQADFLAAFEAGELEGDFVAVLRFQGPAANGMPELHKLTPALGVLQDRGQRVALVTDGRMSGASGKVPAAIHLTPEAAEGGPLARVSDGDLVTLDADAGLLELHVADYELDGARAGRARRRADARHRARAVRLVPRRGRPGRRGRQRLPRPDEHPWRSAMSESLLDRVPVIPVVVLHDLAHAVPVARALVDGGLPVIELTLRTPVALDAIERDCAGGAGDPGRGRHHRRPRAGGASRGPPAPSSWSRRAPPSPWRPRCRRPACRTCRVPRRSRRCSRLLELGYTELKFFPAEASGGADFLKSISSPVPQARFCPTGGITAATAADYLALPNVGCVGGSWLTPAAALAEKDWAAVAALAAGAATLGR